MIKQLNFLLVFGVLAGVIHIGWMTPDMDEDEEGPESLPGYIEDDMIIDLPRNGILENQRWPNANIYYNITGNYNAPREQYIRDAMDTIEGVTCVRFFPATKNRRVHVRITALAKGCYAEVGYNGKQRMMNLQKHNLDTGCFRRGIIIHELLHVLGFRHQHCASDRDDFIEIHFENIIPGKETFFQKYNETQITDFGFGYDYASILHYRRNSFSVNGLDTITPLDPNVEIGEREHLSVKDIDKINAINDIKQTV